jgi:hypothetical protein
MGIVKLDGWNYIPRGYGLQWDLSGSPRWLRVWFRFPVLDRFAYTVVIRRGFASVTPHRGWTDEDREQVPPGWRITAAEPVTTPIEQRPWEH